MYHIIVATPELTLLAGQREGPAVSWSHQGELPGLTYLCVYCPPTPTPRLQCFSRASRLPLSTALSSD